AQPDGRSERIAAEGRTVLARTNDAEHVAVADHCGDGQDAAAKSLSEQVEVRNDTLTVARESLTDPAETRLDLIGDEQHVLLIADLTDPRQVALRRDDDPGFALDRFHEDSYGLVRDGRGDGIRIAVGHDVETGRERAEALARGVVVAE